VADEGAPVLIRTEKRFVGDLTPTPDSHKKLVVERLGKRKTEVNA
jgi:hypothetical protein